MGYLKGVEELAWGYRLLGVELLLLGFIFGSLKATPLRQPKSVVIGIRPSKKSKVFADQGVWTWFGFVDGEAWKRQLSPF